MTGRLSVDTICQMYLLLLAITAVKPNEVDAIRSLTNISATGIYFLICTTILVYFIARKKISSQLFTTIFIVFLLFLFNKLSRVIFLDEPKIYDLEIGFIFFFLNLLILSNIQKKFLLVNLLSIYITLTAVLLIFVLFQDPSEYGKFNETTNAFNFPFTPIGMNKNSFSLMLTMAGMSCIVMIKLNKWPYFNTFLLIIFTMFVLILVTRSHLPLICSIWIWLIWGLKRYWNLLALIFTIFFIVVGTLFFISHDFFLSKDSDSTRYEMFAMSVSAFLDYPFTGQGVILLLEQQQKFLTNDHNQFSLFSGYFGVLGLMIIVFFVCFVFRSFWGLGAINWFLLSSSFLIALSFTPFIYSLSCLIALSGVKLIACYEFELAKHKSAASNFEFASS